MSDAMQAAGNLVGGVAGYEAGKYNRKVSRIEAVNAERDGVAEEARIREAARIAMGDQVNAQGSNGFTAGSGSALDALGQSAVNAALDSLTLRRQTQAKARSIRQGGDIAYAQGENALTQGMFTAASKAVDWADSRNGRGG